MQVNNYVWDQTAKGGAGEWRPEVQSSGGGGGGGGGDASAANQATQIDRLNTINTSVGTVKTSTDAVATAVGTGNTSLADAVTRLGAVDEGAPASDVANAGINGRLKRLTQRVSAIVAALPATLGAKLSAASLSVTPATDVGFPQSAPRVASATIVSLATNAAGATFNTFAAQSCTALNIVNTQPTAVDLEVRRGGAGSTIVVPAGSSYMFVGITNASDLQVRRLDVSNTPVTFTGEALA